MALLGLLHAGGSLLGQVVDQVTGSSLVSTLLVACAFTLSLAYLYRLPLDHLAHLSPGAVGTASVGRARPWQLRWREGGWVLSPGPAGRWMWWSWPQHGC